MPTKTPPSASMNHLPTRFDPKLFRTRSTTPARAISMLSLGDLQQVLCESIEALEQLETLLPNDIANAWRIGEELPGPVESVDRSKAPTGVWKTPAKPSVDADGVKNALNKVYTVTGFQWEEGGVVIQVEDMGKADLQQAVCHCMETISRMEVRLEQMKKVIFYYVNGALVPYKEPTKRKPRARKA